MVIQFAFLAFVLKLRQSELEKKSEMSLWCISRAAHLKKKSIYHFCNYCEIEKDLGRVMHL